MPTLRVILDTNVLLSGIAFSQSNPGQIVSAWRQGSIDVVLSSYILDELRRNLPKLTKYHGLSSAEINDLVESFYLLSEIVEPIVEPIPSEDPALRDISDEPVLGALIAAKHSEEGIDYLITGDKDLIALAAKYPTIKPAEFWQLHAGIKPGSVAR